MTTLRRIGFVIILGAVGMSGVVVGQKIRDARTGGSAALIAANAPKSLLHEGDPFPSVELFDESGRTTSSVTFAGDDGCVVLFLDLECPPCTDMVARWQHAVDDGVIAAGQIAAVSYHPEGRIADYRDELAIDFPIYRDANGVFLRTWEVDRFPLEVIVGRSGIIRSTNYDSASPINPDVVEAALAQ